MKKIVFILGIVTLLFALIACGDAVDSTVSSTEDGAATTDAPTTTEGVITAEHYTAVVNDFVWEDASVGDLQFC